MTLPEALDKLHKELPGATLSVSEHLGLSASGNRSRTYTLHVRATSRTTEIVVLQPDLAAAVDKLIGRVRERLSAEDDAGDALAVAGRGRTPGPLRDGVTQT